jgi:hypothetical protein
MDLIVPIDQYTRPGGQHPLRTLEGSTRLVFARTHVFEADHPDARRAAVHRFRSAPEEADHLHVMSRRQLTG